jgi:hypothetical protein
MRSRPGRTTLRIVTHTSKDAPTQCVVPAQLVDDGALAARAGRGAAALAACRRERVAQPAPPAMPKPRQRHGLGGTAAPVFWGGVDDEIFAQGLTSERSPIAEAPSTRRMWILGKVATWRCSKSPRSHQASSCLRRIYSPGTHMNRLRRRPYKYDHSSGRTRCRVPRRARPGSACGFWPW